jgi:serine/threonine protein kinase/Leucine-rich repeat (LRR) protein
MGSVYLARDIGSGQKFAFKILKQDLAADQSAVRRFFREARILESLDHANIVKVRAAGEADGLYYLVTELISGWSLDHAIKNKLIASAHQAVQIAEDVASALAVAHQAGIVHRDVKPHNIFLTKDMKVRLGDFGLAKETSSDTTSLTTTGNILGTPIYMAPEQWRGETPTPQTDIYSLGVVLYEMLAGRPPFGAETPHALMAHALNDELPPASNLNPGVDSALDRVIHDMTAIDPARRYASASALARDLRAYRDGQLYREHSRFVISADVIQELAGPKSRPESPAISPPKDRPAPRAKQSVPLTEPNAIDSPPRLMPAVRALARSAAMPFTTGLRRRWVALAAAGLGAIAVVAYALVTVLDDRVDLLDNSDLSGWYNPNPNAHGDLRGWHMEGDVLTNLRTDDPRQRFDFRNYNIATLEDWRDFDLSLEYKLSPSANTGVSLRGCVEIQLWDNAPGEGDPDQRHGAIYRQRSPIASPARPAGEWNRLEATLVGDRLAARLNGTMIHDNVQITGATNPDLPGDPVLGGPLLFQNYGDYQVWFRNIRIRSLDPKIDGFPPPLPDRAVRFPAGDSEGDVYLADWNWERYGGSATRVGPAEGAVQVPAGQAAGISIRPQALVDLSFLQYQRQIDLQFVVAESSRFGQLRARQADWQTYYPDTGRASVTAFDALTRMKFLHTVGFVDYSLPADIFAVLADCDYLVQIGFNYTNLDHFDFDPLARIKSLRALDLSRTNVSDSQLAAAGELTNLERLDLDYTPVSDRGIANLADLTNLREISLTATNITDATLKNVIPRFKQLRILSLTGTSVSDAGLARLKGLVKLEQLWVGGTRVTDAGTTELIRALPNCRLRSEP